MPWGDRSGPTGMGPRTGRAAGYCVGNERPGALSGFWGALGGWGRGGFGGRGRGGGRWGWRNWFHATGLTGWQRGAGWGGPGPVAETAISENAALKRQAEVLQAQLDAIQKRMDEIKSDSAEE